MVNYCLNRVNFKRPCTYYYIFNWTINNKYSNCTSGYHVWHDWYITGFIIAIIGKNLKKNHLKSRKS